jgi:hypothetical protein
MRATALTRIGRNQHQPSHRRGRAGQGRRPHWNRVSGSHDMPALQVFTNVSRTRVLGMIWFCSLRCRNIVLRCQGDLTIDDHHTTGAHYSLWNPLLSRPLLANVIFACFRVQRTSCTTCHARLQKTSGYRWASRSQPRSATAKTSPGLVPRMRRWMNLWRALWLTSAGFETVAFCFLFNRLIKTLARAAFASKLATQPHVSADLTPA